MPYLNSAAKVPDDVRESVDVLWCLVVRVDDDVAEGRAVVKIGIIIRDLPPPWARAQRIITSLSTNRRYLCILVLLWREKECLKEKLDREDQEHILSSVNCGSR